MVALRRSLCRRSEKIGLVIRLDSADGAADWRLSKMWKAPSKNRSKAQRREK
jgi:hypothetical protein